MVRPPTAAALAILLAACATPAFAAPPVEPHPLPVPDEALWAPQASHAVVPREDCGCRRRNEVMLTIPVWVPGVTGTFASGSTSVTADRPDGDAVTNLPDIATSIEFAFMGRVDARFGRWVVYGDVFSVSLDETLDARVDRLDASGGVDAVVARLLGGYRAVDHKAIGGGTAVDVDAMVGARLAYAEIRLDEPEALSFSVDDTWVDPLVAARVRVDFPGPVDLQVLADVGGFGLGESSDLSWSVTVEASWRISRLLSVLVGYSWLSVDYDVGGADDRFRLDLDLRGPQVGLTFHL